MIEQLQQLVGIAWPGLAGIEDEQLAGGSGQADRATRQGKGMLCGKSHQQAFSGDLLAVNRSVLDRQAAETGVDTTVFQRGDLRHRVHLDQVDLDLRGGLAQPPDHVGHRAVDRRAYKADDEASATPRRMRRHGRFELVYRVAHALSMIEQKPPGIRQAHRTTLAIEQLHAQLLLQFAYLATERRLGDAQHVGCARKAALTGDSQEIAQVA